MQPLHSTDRSISSTDVVVQLVLLLMRFVERCGTEVRDGDSAACVECEQEDQASSPLDQGVCEQLPLIERDPGQVDFTPVHTNTHIERLSNCMFMQVQ